MATVTLEISEKLKGLAEQRAAEAGLTNLSDYLFQLLLSDAGGGPPGVTVDSEEDLEQLALSRADGPWVEVNAEDFQQMREKLVRLLDEEKNQK